MTLHVPRLPIPIHPLIAEAKRRARQRRRLLLAFVAVIAAGAAVGGTLGLRSSGEARPPVVTAPSCRTNQLHLSWRFDGAGAGTVYNAFSFRNTSGRACALSGWPRFRFVMHDGRTITPHARKLIATVWNVNDPPPVPRLVLRPGAAARLTVFGPDGTGFSGQCPQTRTVLIVPPDAHAPLSVSAPLFYCGPRAGVIVLPFGRRQ